MRPKLSSGFPTSCNHAVDFAGERCCGVAALMVTQPHRFGTRARIHGGSLALSGLLLRRLRIRGRIGVIPDGRGWGTSLPLTRDM